MKPAKAADEPTATPTILGGAPAEYTGQAQKIVTDLPDGMRYFISTEKIDPATIDAGKIVPVGYTALDYLQGTGTQYIDTGFATTTGMVVRYAASWNGSSGSDCVVGVNAISHNYALLRPNERTWEMGYGDKAITAGSGYGMNIKYTVRYSTVSGNGYLEVNNERLITDNSTQSTPDKNVLLFTSTVSNIDGTAIANLYYATIWDSASKLVRDFVPVRTDNGTLGMYDLCTGELYENDGTGDFVAGDAVNTTIKDWEWLDSVDTEANNIMLEYDQTYYVYYYTPNTDTTTVTPLAVKEFTVACNTHVYGEWQTTTPATCTTDGVREHVCQGCGHVDSEVVPATGHKYNSTFDQTTGKTVFTCSVCQNSYEYDCTDREHGHDFINSVIAPDCTDIGSTKHTCTRCHYSYEDNFVPARGHSYGAWVTTEPATTDHAGVQKRTCEHCGAEQTRTLPALAGTTTNGGGKDNTGPLLWGIIIGVIAVLAGCGGLAWLLLAVFKPRRQKKEKVAAA